MAAFKSLIDLRRVVTSIFLEYAFLLCKKTLVPEFSVVTLKFNFISQR